LVHVGDFVVAKTKSGVTPLNAPLWNEDSLHTRMMRSIGRSTGAAVVATGACDLVDTEFLRHAAFLLPFPMDATFVDVVNIAFSYKPPEAIAHRSEDEGYGGAV